MVNEDNGAVFGCVEFMVLAHVYPFFVFCFCVEIEQEETSAAGWPRRGMEFEQESALDSPGPRDRK